jgi:diaminopropionate ammonia-lyase
MSLFINPAADPALVTAASGEAVGYHRALPGYAPTPLHDLAGMHQGHDLARLRLKDESNRFGLPSFKVLGTTWAVERALAEQPDAHTLVAASAGNHGRAVAHVARQRGLRARVYLPRRAAPARRLAIESEGAEAIVVNGDYETAVSAASEAAAQPGWVELADVGVTGPARWVIDGYATLFAELPSDVDTIVVPAGVGSLAAAASRHGAHTGARVIAVEPDAAACVSASLTAGEPVRIDAPGTTMAGLDCSEVSPAAWPDLRHGIHAAVTVSDAEGQRAMRELAAAGLRIGDCGAAPLAALGHLDRQLLGDRVVLIATEGVTDPDSYERTIQGGG